jgi:hypothetical protein
VTILLGLLLFAQFNVPVSLTMEDGTTVPSDVASTIQLRLIPAGGGKALETTSGSRSIAVPIAANGLAEKYIVQVDQVPDRYRLKSVTFGDIDLISRPFEASLQNLVSPASPHIPTFTGEGELQRIIDEIMRDKRGPRTISITLAKKTTVP